MRVTRSIPGQSFAAITLFSLLRAFSQRKILPQSRKALLFPSSPEQSPPMRPPTLLFLFLLSFFIWQPTLVEYFTSFFVIRVDMGSLHMCSLLGDFPRMQPLSHLVSNHILFNLLSIYSRMCLSRDVPTFYR